MQQPESALGRARRARPADADWQKWTKETVVAEPPPGVDLVAFRDPFVFRDDEGWRTLVGAGTSDGHATALVYASDDLASWRYAGELARRSAADMAPVWTGSLWECVQLVPVRDGTSSSCPPGTRTCSTMSPRPSAPIATVASRRRAGTG